MSKYDFGKQLVNAQNATRTENGAEALKSTLNACLDAFSKLGVMRDKETDREILELWEAAFYEDRETAMRLLFYIRDIRGGQGARRVFRTIVRKMAYTELDYVVNNLPNFLEFGRGDDLIELIPCLSF